MNKLEEWRDVIGYEGCYKISNIGRVKSIKRKGVLNDRLLSPCPNSYGYLCVALSKNGAQKSMRVHQLVAQSFLNHKACGLRLVIDHINNDKLNNIVENLQIITNRENVSKDRKGGTSKYLGVSWCRNRGKWVSIITINNKNEILGVFTSELEAAKAYKKRLKEYEKSKR